MTDVTQPRVGRGKTMPVAIAAAALFALLAFAPLASAATDPVASGTATVTLNGGFKNKLKKYGVKVTQIKPAKWTGGTKATFPVTGGELDPTTGLGTVSLGGGLKFKAGKKVANLKSLVINTSKKELSGNVAGKKLKVATLAGWTAARNGFGVNLTIKSLRLTGAAAKQLNKKLGFPIKPKPKKKSGKKSKRAGASKAAAVPFKANQVLGSSAAETQPSTVAVVPAGNATLALAPSALKKLKHVGTPPYPEGASPVEVKLAPIAPTAFDVPTLTASFPIGGGTMGPTATAGTLQTLGGLELTQSLEALTADKENVTTLRMQNIWVDLAQKTASVEVVITNPKTPEANLGNLGRASIADVSLVGATVTSDPAAHTVSVQGATATLQAVTAETLNQVFINGLEKANPAFAGQEKFAAGDPLGVFSFVAQTQ
jgi:hypothetical protein